MEKIEDSEAFSEANMDMTIQLYILTVHVLTGLIYMLQHITEKHPSKYPAAKHPKHHKLKVSRV